MNKPYDIGERALEFAVRTASFVRCMPADMVSYEYGRQLIRSSSSIGANVNEADGTLTKKDFVCKLSISRREARESRYWLRLILKTGLVPGRSEEITVLIKEAGELTLILSSIINKTMGKLQMTKSK